MKTPQEIAAKTPCRAHFNRKMRTGVAQDVILNALGIKAECFGHATEIFKALGIVVHAVRDGRSSVPVVKLIDETHSQQNEYGDYDIGMFKPSEGIDLSAIAEWIK